jgi:lipopolysaccharide export system permease protein
MKNFTPTKLISYLIQEFFYCLFLVFLVFLSLSLLINFVEEINFFKEKNVDNLIFTVSYLSLYKTPNTIIELSIFIILFSGILFFVRLKKNSEINTILLAGLSKLLPILVPAITSFFIGLLIIFLLSPISSSLLKFYEGTKRLYSSNENLMVINNNGLWFMENTNNGFNIIRADTISDNNFYKLKNVTIYYLDQDFNFLKRMDTKEVSINDKKWFLEDTKITTSSPEVDPTRERSSYNIDFLSSLNINDLKEYFSNVNTVSFWEITKDIQKLNERGYSGEELKVKLHKYLSLPLYLFGMILISTIFTIGINKDYNTLMYLFFGMVLGFVLYFLNDLSVVIGLANKLPLALSIWSPIMLIMIISTINLIKINES